MLAMTSSTTPTVSPKSPAGRIPSQIVDIHATKPSPLTPDLLERISQLHEIEAKVRG